MPRLQFLGQGHKHALLSSKHTHTTHMTRTHTQTLCKHSHTPTHPPHTHMTHTYPHTIKQKRKNAKDGEGREIEREEKWRKIFFLLWSNFCIKFMIIIIIVIYCLSLIAISTNHTFSTEIIGSCCFGWCTRSSHHVSFWLMWWGKNPFCVSFQTLAIEKNRDWSWQGRHLCRKF